LGYNLLFRWFVGLSMQDEPWDHSTFSKNRDRLIEHDACQVLFEEVLAQARAGELTAIYVPESADEALRDLVRAREDAVAMQRQARHRLQALLLRNAAIVWPSKKPRTGGSG
jgi:hypothetical protein